MPGSSRRSAGVRPATRRVSWATVSAAFRYARILNGFSPLISRRSPISVKHARDGEIIHVITIAATKSSLRFLQESQELRRNRF